MNYLPVVQQFRRIPRGQFWVKFNSLEFDRVIVVMDDIDAKGFLFKYEDLFGGKAAGDKTLEATKRLFYVTCSRAEKSLALVAYTKDPQRIRSYVLNEGWFTADEVVVGFPKAI